MYLEHSLGVSQGLAKSVGALTIFMFDLEFPDRCIVFNGQFRYKNLTLCLNFPNSYGSGIDLLLRRGHCKHVSTTGQVLLAWGDPSPRSGPMRFVMFCKVLMPSSIRAH